MEKVKQAASWLTKWFTLIVIVWAAINYFVPAISVWAKGYTGYLLGIVLFGMALTLSVDDFARIIKQPLMVIVGTVAHYVIMPLVAVLLCWIFPQKKTIREMNWKEALIFGIGQMLALIPGVSRSGGTITFGRAMGYTREDAVRVSFLMAIPAVFGAGILETVKSVGSAAADPTFPGWGATIAATIVSFVVGYVVIIGFLKFVSTFSYRAFAIYRIVIAVIVAILLIAGALQPMEQTTKTAAIEMVNTVAAMF